MKAEEVFKEIGSKIIELGKNKKIQIAYVVKDKTNKNGYSQTIAEISDVIDSIKLVNGTLYITLGCVYENELNFNKVIKIQDGQIESVDNVISVGRAILQIELWEKEKYKQTETNYIQDEELERSRRRRVSEQITELRERIVRLENKEAEAYGKIQTISKLYLNIEDLNMKVNRLLEEVECALGGKIY